MEDEARCIECEGCVRWFHSVCVGIHDDGLFDLFAALPGAHWSCSVCEKAAPRISKLERKVAEIPKELKKLETNISNTQEMISDNEAQFYGKLIC